MTMPTDTLGYQGMDPEYVRAQRAIQTMSLANAQLAEMARNAWDAIRHLAKAVEEYIKKANAGMDLLTTNNAQLQKNIDFMIQAIKAQAQTPAKPSQVVVRMEHDPGPEIVQLLERMDTRLAQMQKAVVLLIKTAEPPPPAPAAPPPAPPKPLDLIDLGISVRAYNLIEKQVGEAPTEEQLLSLNPRLQGFGKVSFMEITEALRKAGVSFERIQKSGLWQNAPRQFCTKTFASRLEGGQ